MIKEKQTLPCNIIRDVLHLSHSVRNPSSYALVWEDAVLSKGASKDEYSWAMSVLQLYSFGRIFFKEYVKPEAIPLCKSNSCFCTVLDKYSYNLEHIFSCYGLFAVNLATVAYLSGNIESFFNDFCVKDVYLFDWGYDQCLKLRSYWCNIFDDPIKALVNYKYTLNLYERKTSMRLKRREREYQKVYTVWGDRFCNMDLKEHYKIMLPSQYTSQIQTMQ